MLLIALAVVAAAWYFAGMWVALGLAAALLVLRLGGQWIAVVLVVLWLAHDHFAKRRRNARWEREERSRSATKGY